MKKSDQAAAMGQMSEYEAAEWLRLLLMAKEAGIPIEVVRSFLQGRAASKTEQVVFHKIIVSGSIQE